MTTLKGWRTIIFHSLYGLPAVLLLVLDQLHAIDLSPLLSLWLSPSVVGAIGTGIYVGAVVLRIITNTAWGCKTPEGSP